MSKDKHKKRDRAYAFLRGLHWTRVWGGGGRPNRPYELDGSKEFSGGMTPTMRYCVERGMAVLKRVTRSGVQNRRNKIDAWTE